MGTFTPGCNGTSHKILSASEWEWNLIAEEDPLLRRLRSCTFAKVTWQGQTFLAQDLSDSCYLVELTRFSGKTTQLWY